MIITLHSLLLQLFVISLDLEAALLGKSNQEEKNNIKYKVVEATVHKRFKLNISLTKSSLHNDQYSERSTKARKGIKWIQFPTNPQY